MLFRHRMPARGFTILELMATIALLGVLAAAAIPMFTGYIERANTNRAIGEIGRGSIELYRWRTNNGGVFPANLAVANVNLGDDPWGNSYVYIDIANAGAGVARTSAAGTEVNTDFDLYSRGPDGGTARQFSTAAAEDDVVRANNGAYIGVAADY